MKQQWAPQELFDHWTLTNEDFALVEDIGQTDYNRLERALINERQREGIALAKQREAYKGKKEITL